MAGKRKILENVGENRLIYFTHETTSFENKGSRTMRPLFPFIISGGKNTERYYFRHISDTTSYKFNVFPEYFGMESGYTEIFPDRIKKILKDTPDAQIFCVFDWDTIYENKTNKAKYVSFVKLIQPYIDAGNVVLCPSMPSFEYWFMLHFKNTTRLVKTCGEMTKMLKPYMMSYFSNRDVDLFKVLKSRQYLENSSWVRDLCANGKLYLAIKRAEKNIKTADANGVLKEQSYSYVYKVFKNVK